MNQKYNLYVIVFLVLVLGTILTGCRDVLHTFYSDASSAQDGIRRGWVPGCLPPGASEIEETHDLDSNTGHGSFSFSHADAEFLRAKLKEFKRDQQLTSGVSRPSFEKRGFEFYVYEDFDLAVNWKTGKAEFWLNRDA